MTEKKLAVAVTDDERAWIRRSLEQFTEAVKKEKKRMENMGLGTDSAREALAVLEGNGVDGGLLTRFGVRDTRDMFGDPAPVGQVRMLAHPEREGESPTECPPLDDDAWVEPEVPVGLAQDRMEESGADHSHYYEAENGAVYQLTVSHSVGWEYLGTRPSSEVDAAVEASERAALDPDDLPAGGNVDTLDALQWASPSARELAKAEKLPVEALAGHGSGKDGKLTKRDVLDALEDRDASEAPEPEPDPED